MVEIKTKSGELRVKIDVEKNIHYFGYVIKVNFIESNQLAYIELTRQQLMDFSREINYLLLER